MNFLVKGLKLKTLKTFKTLMFQKGLCGNGGRDYICRNHIFCIIVENKSHPKLGAVRQFCVVIAFCICWVSEHTLSKQACQ